MFEAEEGRVASYVAYYRVSTGAQARSGLGLAAQRDIVGQFLASVNGSATAEFVEVQSGRKDDRPQLAKALTLARREKASLLIARLDRFSRRVSFVAGIMEQGVRLTVAELPNATDFQLHIFAALAQEERRLISERTRAALAQARQRGAGLGTNGAVLAGRNRAAANEFAARIRVSLERIGLELSLSEQARQLNAAGFRTRMGRLFAPQTIKHLLGRP
jgi:DNA invertase Pin-like site-specific DNA recombinase